jgi:uncharacterized protein with PQ loop repeat
VFLKKITIFVYSKNCGEIFMFFTQSFFAVMATWFAYTTYTLSVLPQIRLNFKRKSASGLSDLFLFGLLNRNLMWVGYIFALGLPFSYKVMGSALALITIILVLQRIRYARRDETWKLFYLYGINMGILFLLVFFAIKYSVFLGHCLGWTNIILGFFNEVPQIMKMHKKRTCKGFSFNFVFIGFIAYCFEFCAALILHFPFQVLLCSFKGIIFRLLFMVQFFAYKRMLRPAKVGRKTVSLYVKRYIKITSFEHISFKRADIKVLRKYNRSKEYIYDFVQ